MTLRTNRTNAIKKHCLDCSGGSPKEVTLCHIVTCPLWPYRFGYSVKAKRYKQRMESARKKYPREYQEMVRLVVEYAQNRPDLLQYVHIDAVPEKAEASQGSDMDLGEAA